MEDATIERVNQITIKVKDFNSKNTYLTVTDWANGEGYDLSFDDNRSISISYDDLEAIKIAILALSNNYSIKFNGK